MTSLDEGAVERVVGEIDEAYRTGQAIPRLTGRFPGMTIEDAYSVQSRWVARRLTAGSRITGHKIGLTSRVMQANAGIDEPDYGVILDDLVHQSGCELTASRFLVPRVEVELAFRLGRRLEGADVSIFDAIDAIDSVIPALEILSTRVEIPGRTVVDTIADNAALGGVVLGLGPISPDRVELTRIGAVLWRNESIEESGVSAAVMGHPAAGLQWLARKLAAFGGALEAGELVLAGSFTRPVAVSAGDVFHADYGEVGTVTCRFT